MSNVMVKCRECGEVKKHHANDLCYACYMRQYRARRAEETSRIRPLIEDLEKKHGPAADQACVWCDASGYAWFMGDPACKKHIRQALEWAQYLLR